MTSRPARASRDTSSSMRTCATSGAATGRSSSRARTSAIAVTRTRSVMTRRGARSSSTCGSRRSDMAIEALYLRLLKQAIELRRSAKPAMQGLLLGYPDLIVPRAALVQILGEDFVAGLATRGTQAGLWAYHGFPAMAEPMHDSIDLMRKLGVDPVVIDAAKLRGMERVVDLNQPLPQDLARRFDLVVDTGTCEHCFNVAQAFCNA